MKLRYLFPVILFTLATPAAAHVGSPDVYYEGAAGPYRLFVTIRMPQVIPGVAEIEIRSQSKDVREIRIVPLRLTGPGSNLPPTPDIAQPSKEDPQFFTGSLWLMEFGSLQVRVMADGQQGKGELSVPVPAVAQRTLKMQRSLGALMVVLMVFLAVGAVAIAAAGVREAKLEPGEEPQSADLRRGRFVLAASSVLVLLVLYFGNQWWSAEAASYAQRIYKNPRVAASVEPGGRLVLRPEDSDWLKAVRQHPLIPDHNHLMHLFLIRAPGLDRLWHLHPDQTEPGVFAEILPTLPAGHYQIFADIVHESGFPETFVTEVDLPSISGKPLQGDDCEWSGSALSPANSQRTISELPDGGRMVWERDAAPLKADVPVSFKFLVEDRNGKPAQGMELYMGMAGHAEFVRSDRTVYAHVHPAGSVSMAALELAQASLMPVAGGPVAGLHGGMAMPAGPVSPEVSFPYGFPKPGDYRIFVQIKRGGKIETGVFDARVE